MANLDVKIPILGTGTIQTLNFNEVADGVGLLETFAAKEDTTYTLTTFAPHSELNTIAESRVIAGTTYTTSGGTVYNFTLGTFQLPKTIKGTAYVESFEDYSNIAGTATLQSQLVFALTKNGTEFVSGSTTAVTVPNGGATSGSIFLKIPITTEQKFKRGDQLGMKYYALGKEQSLAGGGTLRTTIGISPLDEDGTNITPSTNPGMTTITKLRVPIIIYA